ncbi:hypothetical protein [Fundidesulfovibrio magnetotacticus]|uniref:hypothetical protein n=1 Tax=Fundidesulfovibrio magnetotacticus TaxID=2730080 RepID=UPI0015649493|nr:hypothetical protein [Fundidesulfovibrio magnetotacticus]
MTGLLLYEGGKSNVSKEQRSYSDSFNASRTRYINYELSIRFPQPLPQPKTFEILTVFTAGNGSVVCRIQHPVRAETGWKDMYCAKGWGNDNGGAWKPGNYTATVYSEGREVASRNFRVY